MAKTTGQTKQTKSKQTKDCHCDENVKTSSKSKSGKTSNCDCK